MNHSAIEILNIIMERYGLRDLKLCHYKTSVLEKYQGELAFTLMPRNFIAGTPAAQEFLESGKILMIYEHESLGVFIIVHQPKEEEGKK